jgi:hypothetical protein
MILFFLVINDIQIYSEDYAYDRLFILHSIFDTLLEHNTFD